MKLRHGWGTRQNETRGNQGQCKYRVLLIEVWAKNEFLTALKSRDYTPGVF
jgi:hypothetical protein